MKSKAVILLLATVIIASSLMYQSTMCLAKASLMTTNYALHEPDLRVMFGIGTNGLFIQFGSKNYQPEQMSLRPIGQALSKTVEVGYDFFQNNMDLYHFRNGNWTNEPIYSSGDSIQGFLSNGKDVLLMVHGLFTGNYLEWTEAAAYITQQNPDLDIYAVDYGTGYPLAYLGEWLNQLITQGVDDGQKISILAHSQGGLVARAALELHESSRDKVKCLITLATPHTGVDYGNVVADAANRLLNLIPELSDLMSRTSFLNELNSNISRLNIAYYFIAGTSKGNFASYWELIDKFTAEYFSTIINDGVVEKNSALGVGLDFSNNRLQFATAEFPVDHSEIMSDKRVLDQVLMWL